jgi:hypothetical protein
MTGRPVSRASARALVRAGVEVRFGRRGLEAPAWAAIVASAYSDPLAAVEPLRGLLALRHGPELAAAAFGLRAPIPGAAARVFALLGPAARVAVEPGRGDQPTRLAYTDA